MSNWDYSPKETGSNLFVKIKGGESATGVLLGEPRIYDAKWVNGKPVVVPATDPDGKFRFRVNFVSKHEDKWVPKILEGGKSVFNAIKKLKNVGYNLNETVVDYSREGNTQNDTEYSVTATPIKLTPDDIAQLGLLNLNDLTK